MRSQNWKCFDKYIPFILATWETLSVPENVSTIKTIPSRDFPALGAPIATCLLGRFDWLLKNKPLKYAHFILIIYFGKKNILCWSLLKWFTVWPDDFKYNWKSRSNPLSCLAAGFYGLQSSILNKIYSRPLMNPFVTCIGLVANIFNFI